MERSIDEKLKMIENLRMNSAESDARRKAKKTTHSAPVRRFLTGVFIRSSIAGAIFIGLFILKYRNESFYLKVKEQIKVFEMNHLTDANQILEKSGVDFGNCFSYNKKD